MWSYLVSDCVKMLPYLPYGAAAGGVYVLVRFVTNRGRDLPALSLFGQFCLVTYLIVLAQITLLSRVPGSRSHLDLILFSTWGTTGRAHAYVVENGLLFIPFGILMPACVRDMDRFGYCTLSGYFLSTMIEYIQYLTERGYFQADDILMNTVGTIVGWFVFMLLSQALRLIRR